MPNIYAIADLHLCSSVPEKSMDVFGPLWENAVKRLEDSWRTTVREEDLVLIPGDISWAMNLEDALPDLFFLGSLPGKKLLLRGNHDFWWSSVSKIRRILPDNMFVLQNDSFRFFHTEISGCRGWTIPESSGFKESTDRKLFIREKNRFQLSLNTLSPDTDHIVMFHFPPFSENGTPCDLVSMLPPFHVKACVYGHLHGTHAHEVAFQGEFQSTVFSLVSADYLQFKPKLIWTTD